MFDLSEQLFIIGIIIPLFQLVLDTSFLRSLPQSLNIHQAIDASINASNQFLINIVPEMVHEDIQDILFAFCKQPLTFLMQGQVHDQS